MNRYLLASTVEMHWGFIVRQIGTSAAQLAYLVPPPPTIVGVFMNPLARIAGISDAAKPRRLPKVATLAMECGIRATLAAAAGLEPESSTGVVIYEEPSRIIGAAYKAGGSYERKVKLPAYEAVAELLPVQAVGATSAPKARLILVWLLDLDFLNKCLGSSLGFEELREAAWSVYRVGSREGAVSIISARIYPEEELIRKGPRFSSILYQSIRCATPVAGSTVETILPSLPDYTEDRFAMPAGMPGAGVMATPPLEPVVFEAKSNCSVLEPREEPSLALATRLV